MQWASAGGYGCPTSPTGLWSPIGAKYGTSVSNSETVAAQGAPGAGAAFFWVIYNNAWALSQTLYATGGGTAAGFSVAVDGNYAMIGAPNGTFYSKSCFSIVILSF